MDKKESRDGIITLVSITLVNALNYGLNLILGRWLGPEIFAETNILATLVLILSFAGIAIQLTVANQIARYAGNTHKQKEFYNWIERQILKISMVASILAIVGSAPLSAFLQMQGSFELITIAIGIPFYFLLCARRGYYQGAQEFKRFSLTFIVETFGRLTITLLILSAALYWNPEYAVLSIALGFLASFLFAFIYTLKHISFVWQKIAYSFKSKEIVYFVMAISMYELSQILINNCDVILVKHYFDDFQAGLYASIALIGRIVYFGTWTIVTLLFPKVIEKEKKGESHILLFYNSLAIVSGCGAIITLVCLWQGDLILNILFGGNFVEVHPLLWKYALSTTLFATANVFAYYYMSLKNYLPVIISLMAGLIQILFISIMNGSLLEIVYVQIAVMSGLLLSMISYHFFKAHMGQLSGIFRISKVELS